MCLPISLEMDKEIANITVKMKALIDTEATDSFIDKYFVEQHRIPTAPLDKSFVLWNADGTPNKIRDITQYTWLKTNHGIVERFLVAGLGKDHCILGMSWLKRINPVLDWEKGTIQVDESWISKLMGHACCRSMETTMMRHMYKQETKDSPVNVGTEEVQAKESPELVIEESWL